MTRFRPFNRIASTATDKRRARGLLGDKRGAIAMEAGLVMPVYLYMLLFVLQLCVFFFMQEVLDNATSVAARSIQVGSTSSQGTSATQFVQSVVCPNLNGLIDCSKVFVYSTSVADFYANANFTPPTKKDGTLDQTKMTYCGGSPSTLMILHTIYNAPLNMWPLIKSVQNTTMITSTAAFRNEAYPSTGASTC